MTERACERCGDSGYVWRVPTGVNPFKMRIEQIAKVSRKVRCECAQFKKREESDDARGTD